MMEQIISKNLERETYRVITSTDDWNLIFCGDNYPTYSGLIINLSEAELPKFLFLKKDGDNVQELPIPSSLRKQVSRIWRRENRRWQQEIQEETDFLDWSREFNRACAEGDDETLENLKTW